MGAVLQSATLGIDVVVKNIPELSRLEKELERLQQTYDKLVRSQWEYSEAKQIVSAENRNEIQTLRNSNVLLQAKSNMTNKEIRTLMIEKNLQRDLNAELEKRMMIESRALDIQHGSRGLMGDDYARYLAEESFAVEEAEERKRIAMRATEAVANQQRKALMAASISMFVLNISLGQLVQSIKPFVKGNKDAEKAVMDMQNALRFSMAPLQAYMALQMISTSLAASQKVAFMGVATSLGAIFFYYQAITAKSAGMRAAYAAIAVALTAVAAASWLAAYGTASLKAALTGNVLPLIAVTAGLAAAMGAIAYVTAPKAQTLTGHRKRVRKGGMAELDDDEVVQRVSKDGTKSGGGGDTIIMLPESYNGSMADAKITAHTVKRMMNGGYGTIKYQRKVVTGG